MYFMKRIRLPKVNSNKRLIKILAIILSSIVIYISWRYTNFRLNFSLLNVYDLREEARNFNLPIVLSYLWSATTNALPVFMVYYYLRGNSKIFWLLAFVIFLNFSINGSKSMIFKMLFCLMLVYIHSNNYNKVIIYGLISLCILSLLEHNMFETSFISNIIIRRVFFIPVLLDYLYYDYININGPIYYDNIMLDEIAFNIGNIYYEKEDMRCNNGLFSDAYMNLGILGCFIYPFLYSCFFKCLSTAFRNIDSCIVFYVILIIVTTIGSSSFTTSLFTHGLLLLSFTVYCMPKSVLK